MLTVVGIGMGGEEVLCRGGEVPRCKPLLFVSKLSP